MLSRQRFDEVVSQTISDELLTPMIEIDQELDLNSLTPKFHRIISQMAPFGPAEHEGRYFLVRNVKDTGWAKIVGDDHLKMTLQQEGAKERFGAIAFRQAEQLPIVRDKKLIDIACTIEENEWQGNVSLQLNVKAIRKSEV